jgi:hypothetical protein
MGDVQRKILRINDACDEIEVFRDEVLAAAHNEDMAKHNRQVVQKPHKPHAASCGFLALCKAMGRISISRPHKPTGSDSYKYHFECSVHAAIQSDPVNIMICP